MNSLTKLSVTILCLCFLAHAAPLFEFNERNIVEVRGLFGKKPIKTLPAQKPTTISIPHVSMPLLTPSGRPSVVPPAGTFLTSAALATSSSVQVSARRPGSSLIGLSSVATESTPLVIATSSAVISGPAPSGHSISLSVSTTSSIILSSSTPTSSVIPSSEVQTSAVSISSSVSASSPAPTGNTTDTSDDSCPLPSVTTSKRSRDYFFGPLRRFFRRAIEDPQPNALEFVGFHGTNSGTAATWMAKGELVKPSGGGTSGGGAELGPGLYVSDDVEQAQIYANGNASKNKSKPQICAIFAKNSAQWRALPKVEFSQSLFKNKNQKARADILHAFFLLSQGRFDATQAIVFGSLAGKANQMVIPEGLNPQFSAQCFNAEIVEGDGMVNAQNMAQLPQLPAGVLPVTDEARYSSDERREQWTIQIPNNAILQLAPGFSCGRAT
ncbi:hypothetical protein QCA50_009820 [Cerrena zonata]|uniref:Uncharacterized protein n=1 Tax=Cerrena zonata TaxID=2478898 RepID=A0AAW0G6H3_9APHY